MNMITWCHTCNLIQFIYVRSARSKTRAFILKRLNLTNDNSPPMKKNFNFKISIIGLQPTKTRAELDSSTVLKQIFYEYHYIS